MILKHGDKNADVLELQTHLIALGYLKAQTPTDYFGTQTLGAVKAFQRANKLLDDGIVGDKTLSVLQSVLERSSAIDKSDEYAEMVAKDLGVEPAMIKAFAKVESSGAGFLKDGKIKVLFERHIFRRRLIEEGMDLLVAMLDKEIPDLCNKQTGGYVGGAAENTRLVTACRYHRQAALESASYGKFQIMGFRYGSCGFTNVYDFYNHLIKGEKEQYEALGNFIKNDPKLHKAIRAKDFLSTARIYNGPAQKGYDSRLEAAYNQYA